jgi:phage FluMu protein Com
MGGKGRSKEVNSVALNSEKCTSIKKLNKFA